MDFIRRISLKEEENQGDNVKGEPATLKVHPGLGKGRPEGNSVKRGSQEEHCLARFSYSRCSARWWMGATGTPPVTLQLPVGH